MVSPAPVRFTFSRLSLLRATVPSNWDPKMATGSREREVDASKSSAGHRCCLQAASSERALLGASSTRRGWYAVTGATPPYRCLAARPHRPRTTPGHRETGVKVPGSRGGCGVRRLEHLDGFGGSLRNFETFDDAFTDFFLAFAVRFSDHLSPTKSRTPSAGPHVLPRLPRLDHYVWVCMDMCCR